MSEGVEANEQRQHRRYTASMHNSEQRFDKLGGTILRSRLDVTPLYDLRNEPSAAQL
jgi:hypothetical protein